MKYEAIIFDVSDTLVEYSPNWAQVFGGKIRSLGFDVSEEMTWKINNAVYWANGEQTRREQNGAPRATEDELNRMMNEAALSCVDCPIELKETYLQIMLDVLCAKQAGMDCAWIARKGDKLHESIPFSEDYRISKVTQLLDIL